MIVLLVNFWMVLAISVCRLGFVLLKTDLSFDIIQLMLIYLANFARAGK